MNMLTSFSTKSGKLTIDRQRGRVLPLLPLAKKAFLGRAVMSNDSNDGVLTPEQLHKATKHVLRLSKNAVEAQKRQAQRPNGAGSTAHNGSGSHSQNGVTPVPLFAYKK